MILSELPINERPREKALKYGVSTLSNRELLAILLRSGINNISSLELADNILIKSNGLKGIRQLGINELKKIKGIQDVKAIELLVTFELANRILYQESLDKNVVSSPESLINWLRLEIGYLKQENFVVIFLDTKHHIIDYKIVFKGTLNASLVHAREIYKEAISKSASAIIVSHNHPSGDCTPSKADIEVSERLYDVGNLMEIRLIDHIIVSENDYFSFAKNSLL